MIQEQTFTCMKGLYVDIVIHNKLAAIQKNPLLNGGHKLA